MPFSVKKFEKEFCAAMEDCRTGDASELVMRTCANTNQWIAELEPWKMVGWILIFVRARATIGILIILGEYICRSVILVGHSSVVSLY